MGAAGVKIVWRSYVGARHLAGAAGASVGAAVQAEVEAAACALAGRAGAVQVGYAGRAAVAQVAELPWVAALHLLVGHRPRLSRHLHSTRYTLLVKQQRQRQCSKGGRK